MAASLLQQHLDKIRVPISGERVHKDECTFSFDTPESENGLYICMNTFMAFGKKHVDRHYKKTGNAVYLRLKRIRKEIPKSEEPESKQPTKLAIGVAGGFDPDMKQYEFEETTSIVVLPDWIDLPMQTPGLPLQVALSTAAILTAEDAWKVEEAAAMAGTWEGEKRYVSKHATNLLQLTTGKKIPPRGWKCEMCDLTNNLWLNLTDGTILCGRKFFDGSGGNNHALDHYAEARHPLAVKLGTITPDGADVFSYDEDDMVEDPFLEKHLEHWGINITRMEKTEKTMIELEIDANQRLAEWDVIQEAGSKLTPLYGPGFTGMRNLGNSCYMNSVMQVMFTLPDFQTRYAQAIEGIFENAPADPTCDFNTQISKLGHGLLSGEYSVPPAEGAEELSLPRQLVRPQMFKTLIGRGHPEFSTKKQQDSQEFLLHLINVIERNSRGTLNPTDCLKFEVEERVQCVQSKKVAYTRRPEYCLSLNVPLNRVTNKDDVDAYETKKAQLEAEGKKIDVKELVRPKISLASCLEMFSAEEIVEDFYSPALQAKSTAHKTTRLSTFPDYLMVQLKKYTVGEDWLPKKLDVSVGVPDQLDLSPLRGTGLQAGEEEMPDEQTQPAMQLDDAVVAQLVEMGFAREGCRKAVYNTNNTGVEPAMNWIMEHMEDADFAEPFRVPGASKSSSTTSFTPNEESVSMIVAMGFTREQAVKALKETDNNLERAADWVFSHSEEMNEPMETDAAASLAPPSQYRNGPGQYQLVAFISHMGTSTMVGHYVCHILKKGRWVIFNDEKVALSEHPPKDLAYLYLYQRV